MKSIINQLAVHALPRYMLILLSIDDLHVYVLACAFDVFYLLYSFLLSGFCLPFIVFILSCFCLLFCWVFLCGGE